jgi:hypothetical protein
MKHFGLAMWFAVALSVSVPFCQSTAQIAVKLETGQIDTVKPPRPVIKIVFYDANGNQLTDVLKLTDAVKDPASYTILAEKDKKTETIAVERVIVGSDPFVSRVGLLPKGKLKDDVTYRVQVKEGVFVFKDSTKYVLKGEPPAVDGDQLKAELDYINNRALENKIELLNGTTNGAGSARATYRSYFSDEKGVDWLQVEAIGKADFNFLSQDKSKYLNSIVGELGILYVNTWEITDRYGLPAFIGINGTVESDQDFRTVDSTGGVEAQIFLRNWLSEHLYTFFVRDIKEAGVAPLLKLGYSYVGHVKEGIRTDTGSQRFHADFYWSLPLYRGFDIRSTHITQQLFDADLILDIETIYDVEKSKFFDNSKVVVDIHAQTLRDKSPSFTLTYAQGKATPTFKNFDAFLAGLKIPF